MNSEIYNDGNCNNTTLPIRNGGISLMCRLTNRNEKSKTYTYKSNYHCRVDVTKYIILMFEWIGGIFGLSEG